MNNDSNNKNEQYIEKAVIVGVLTDDMAEDDYYMSMEELGNLAEACNMMVVARVEQKLDTPNKALYIGPGKLQDVKNVYEDEKADVVIFDNTLSPMQLRNIQNILDCPVMDRTGLILEIFESRARTREARLQVEVAKLQYMLPRLVGLHEALSRQGGGGGSRANKGAGEKKLELDKRRLEHRLSQLRSELKEVKKERITQRKKRSGSGDIRAALVGYTNAGKSTLMNSMIDLYYPAGTPNEDKNVFEKDMLFATLDTTVRRIEPKEHQNFLLSDTVGFISNLPHNLIEAFHSTLEEAMESDVLIHVVDYSDVNHLDQIRVTEETLKELGASDIPAIYVYNKADKVMKESGLPKILGNRIYMSAKNKIGIDELLSLIEKVLADLFREGTFCIPYSEGGIMSYLNDNAVVKNTEYKEDGIYIEAKVREKDWNKYSKYCVDTL